MSAMVTANWFAFSFSILAMIGVALLLVPTRFQIRQFIGVLLTLGALMALVMIGFGMFGAIPAYAASTFDGTYSTVLDCPATQDGARPYKWLFNSKVENGHLLGEHQNIGQGTQYKLEGHISRNGDGSLRASGVSGNADYNNKFTQKGSPIDYKVKVQFTPAGGYGVRQGSRPCTLTWTRL